MRQSPNQETSWDELGSSLRGPKVPIEQLSFQSASEYACAKLLSRYCKWKGMPGATFQVPIGRTFFDFRVGYALVEYHPISLKREFMTPLLRHVQSATKNISRERKAELMEHLAEELKAQYIKRRGQVASASTTYCHMDVICCFSPEEFCSKVVQRYSSGPPPQVADLVKEFRLYLRESKKLSQR